MSTCFQFEEHDLNHFLDVSVKYYWKNLQMLQSEGVKKTVGMNTKGLLCPNVRMAQALS